MTDKEKQDIIKKCISHLCISETVDCKEIYYVIHIDFPKYFTLLVFSKEMNSYISIRYDKKTTLFDYHIIKSRVCSVDKVKEI